MQFTVCGTIDRHQDLTVAAVLDGTHDAAHQPQQRHPAPWIGHINAETPVQAATLAMVLMDEDAPQQRRVPASELARGDRVVFNDGTMQIVQDDIVSGGPFVLVQFCDVDGAVDEGPAVFDGTDMLHVVRPC